MSDRVSQFILLCEDDQQSRLVRAYLRICGHDADVKAVVASRMQHGGNVKWVIEHFPSELYACRQRHKVKAKTLLIVMLDADDFTVSERRKQLVDRLIAAGYEGFGVNEPVVVLVPKRNVETWVRNLLGESVSEDKDYKTQKEFKKEQFRLAADALHAWTRPNARIPENCVPSLAAVLREWNRIC